MPKLKHYDNFNTARFITFSCYHRYQLLVDDRVRLIFLSHLKSICKRHSIDIYGYVIMPEHIHLVVYPRVEVSIGKVIGQLKSKSAREILLQLRRENSSLLLRLTIGEKTYFWQKRCYDHNCRTLKRYLKKSIIATRTRSQGDLLMSLRIGSGQVIVFMREWITLFLRLTVMNVKVVTETHPATTRDYAASSGAPIYKPLGHPPE